MILIGSQSINRTMEPKTTWKWKHTQTHESVFVCGDACRKLHYASPSLQRVLITVFIRGCLLTEDALIVM